MGGGGDSGTGLNTRGGGRGGGGVVAAEAHAAVMDAHGPPWRSLVLDCGKLLSRGSAERLPRLYHVHI